MTTLTINKIIRCAVADPLGLAMALLNTYKSLFGYTNTRDLQDG